MTTMTTMKARASAKGASLRATRALAIRGPTGRSLGRSASAGPRNDVRCRGAVLDTEVASGIKASLLELIDENKTEYRTQINEMLYQLESRNPTLYPTTSPLLNGDWEFKYLAGIAPGPVPSPTREIALFMYAGGYTPGKFVFDLSQKLPSSVLDISGMKVSISPSQPRGKITATLKVLNNAFPLELRTAIEAESDVRMKETYMDAEAVGRDITLPQQLRTERVFYITYLDEDLLISRDESGTPDVLCRAVSTTTAGATEEESAAAPEAEDESAVVEEVEPDTVLEPEEGEPEEDKKSDDAFNSW